jgi:hypothetical protein
MDIQTLSYSDSGSFFPNGRSSLDKEAVVQQVSFGKIGELTSRTESISRIDSLIPSAVMINIESIMTFQRKSTDGEYTSLVTELKMPACACKIGFEFLCSTCGEKSDKNFDSIQNGAMALMDETSGIVVPSILVPVITIDSLGVIQKSKYSNQSMAIMFNSTGSSTLVEWPDNCNLAANVPASTCPYVTESNISAVGKPATFTFILPPVYATNTTGGALLSIGIVTVYITIVYAIGRFLRIVFDKESLRVIYLEIPRPDDFLDLAKGAQTARQYKDLPLEFRLYNCLIKLLRSPETLIALGGADVTGYGVGRTDDPPYPDMLTDQERRSLLRRRRAIAY